MPILYNHQFSAGFCSCESSTESAIGVDVENLPLYLLGPPFTLTRGQFGTGGGCGGPSASIISGADPMAGRGGKISWDGWPAGFEHGLLLLSISLLSSTSSPWWLSSPGSRDSSPLWARACEIEYCKVEKIKLYAAVMGIWSPCFVLDILRRNHSGENIVKRYDSGPHWTNHNNFENYSKFKFLGAKCMTF